jgi:tRNA(Phe) wybutosine-synthesizing methylase Tyw3
MVMGECQLPLVYSVMVDGVTGSARASLPSPFYGDLIINSRFFLAYPFILHMYSTQLMVADRLIQIGRTCGFSLYLLNTTQQFILKLNGQD